MTDAMINIFLFFAALAGTLFIIAFFVALYIAYQALQHLGKFPVDVAFVTPFDPSMTDKENVDRIRKAANNIFEKRDPKEKPH